MTIVTVTILTLSGAYAAWMDLRFRRLPNELVMSVGLLGLLTNLLTGGLPLVGSALIHVGIALAIGFALFGLKVIGGGDGKYYAAVAAWFPMPQAMQLMGWVSVIGFVLAVFFLAQRLRPAARMSTEPVDPTQREVPFGVAIALGAVCAASGLVT
jgi:prepilin peptidase CpaA